VVLKVGQTEGSAVDLDDIERFVHLAGGDRSVIVIIPGAAANPARTGEDHAAYCRRFGAIDVAWLQVWQRGDANSAASVSQVECATGILLLGNDPARWRQLLADTRLLGAIHRQHAAGAVIAATGAGLTLMPPDVLAALDLVEVDLSLLADPGVDPHIEWLGL
jgi:cyanophycinase-like exopeptidase